jgi:ketosteroid isomerase-like protein
LGVKLHGRSELAQQAGARSTHVHGDSSTELVRRAYKAFARRDRTTLRSLCHDSLEFRPVDGLGLVGETIHGFDPSCAWVERREALGFEASVWVRTLEEVGPELVLGVGVVSERGRTGHGYAATVAWIWHVSGGRIDCVHGYPSESAARRALSART